LINKYFVSLTTIISNFISNDIIINFNDFLILLLELDESLTRWLDFDHDFVEFYDRKNPFREFVGAQ